MSTASDPSLDRILNQEVVRVAATWDRSWEQYLDPSTGSPAGMVAKLGELLAEDLGVSVRFVDMPWSDQLQALIDSEVDVCLKHTNVPERARLVRFTTTPLLEYRGVIFVANDVAGIGLEAFRAREGSVAVTSGSLHGQIAREVLAGWEVVSTASAAESLERLVSSRVEAVITDDIVPAPNEVSPLSDPDGSVVVVSCDASYPSVRHQDEMWFWWLNNWMSYHKRQGTLDQIIEKSRQEHRGSGLGPRD